MPQMDKELFVEYIYWIFLILLHHYSSFFVNTNFMKFYARNFVINYFYTETRSLKEQQSIVTKAFENFNKKNF